MKLSTKRGPGLYILICVSLGTGRLGERKEDLCSADSGHA